jgi:anaerobic dimethyl sulfoxide reductase subunit B (iron-sulfur subunit)
MAKQLAFYFDADACIGCKACQVACQDKNNLAPGTRWRRVFNYGGGSWINNGTTLVPSQVFSYYVSTACMHCADATCTDICPAGAMSKNADGVVAIDAAKCIGCRYCEWACPYGAPQFDEAKGVMTKCDMCADLQAQGQKPACVDACVMRALDFGDVDELRAQYGVGTNIEPLPSEGYTGPSMIIKPHRLAALSGSGGGQILNLPEEL